MDIHHFNFWDCQHLGSNWVDLLFKKKIMLLMRFPIIVDDWIASSHAISSFYMNVYNLGCI